MELISSINCGKSKQHITYKELEDKTEEQLTDCKQKKEEAKK